MKKFYFLASVLLAANTLTAQITVDFEDLNLPEDSFYNGDDLEGGFTSHGAIFSNNYNPDWGSWSDFSYSSMKDNTTPSFTNQYSAYPAEGANQSATYGVNTSTGTITFSTEVNVMSVFITNTTYTYLSMRDGDAFSKKFGENGDKDFFYIYIYGHDTEGNKVDSVRIDLADFTSDNATEHYILENWTEFDLTPLQGVKYLTFEYFSSDVGEWGINTPTYFALDNLVYDDASSHISKENKMEFAMFPNPTKEVLHINGEAGEYQILNAQGKVVKSFATMGLTSINITELNPGIYFVSNINYPTQMKKLIIQ